VGNKELELAEQTGLSNLLGARVRFADERVTSGAANPVPERTSVLEGIGDPLVGDKRGQAQRVASLTHRTTDHLSTSRSIRHWCAETSVQFAPDPLVRPLRKGVVDRALKVETTPRSPSQPHSRNIRTPKLSMVHQSPVTGRTARHRPSRNVRFESGVDHVD
jgi:hypothetical protein